jgi:hypothetical protein
MPTYLYCVLTPAKTDRLPPGLTGIGGSPIRSLVLENDEAIEAWVATVNDAVLLARGEALASQALLHNEVVNAALATGRTPAPARYGSRFADDAVCLADLGRRRRELVSVLEQVAGAVEMGVLLVPTTRERVPQSQPKSKEPAAGRRYLESLRSRAQDDERRRAAADTEASRIRALVNDLVRDERRSTTPSVALSISHLVPRERLDEYKESLQAFEPVGPFRIVMADPRAPYSFAEPKSSGAGHDSGSPEPQ